MVKSLGLILLAFILGILLASYVTLSIYISLFLMLVLGCLYLFVWWREINRGLTIIPLLFFFFLGASQFNLHQLKPSDAILVQYAEKNGVEITGTIISDPIIKNNYVRCNFRVEKIRYGQVSRKANETLLLMVKDAGNRRELFYGQRLKLRENLKLPPTSSNPGEFSYRKYLARQNIFTIMQVRDNKRIEFLGMGKVNQVVLFAYKLKKRMNVAFKLSIPEPYCSLLQGIVFGGSSNIPAKMQQDFQATGLTHALAVSGANVAFIVTIFLGFGALFRLPAKLNLIIAAFGVIIYAFATGFGPSVQRASLMMLLGILALIIERDKNIYISLWVAAFIILLRDPSSLFDPGFQFSFTATLSIVAFTPVLQERVYFLPKGVTAFLAVPLVAQLGVLPLQLFYFSQLSSVSLIANLLIAPLLGLTVQFGFFAGLFGLFSSLVAKIFNAVNLLLLIIITKIVSFLAAVPGSIIYIKQTSLFWVILYYACLVWLFIQLQNGNLSTKLRLTKEKSLIFFLILFSLFVFSNLFKSYNKTLKVTYLDVGQGDASVIQTPAGSVILVDGGDNLGNYDYGEKVVIPFLRRNGIDKIDLLFLTHPHNDHLGGLPAVLREISVENVFDTGQVSTNQNYREFLHLVKQKRVKYHIARKGSRIQLDHNIQLQIIHPDTELLKNTNSDYNNNSIVFRLVFRKMSFLFTGDIEADAEKVILKDKENYIRAEVLKAAHHGSKTSSGIDFLDSVKPQLAIISVGKKNHFGHPSRQTLDRLRKNGVKYYRTDLDGAVEITTDGISYNAKNIKMDK